MKIIRTGLKAMDLLNSVLIICRCSVLCLVTCYFNYSVLYLLPLALIIDWGIFLYSYQSVFKSQLRAINKVIDEFKEQNVDLEIVEDDIIREINAEMRKYQLFRWGNKHGEKQMIVIRVNKLFREFKSFVFYNASSIIFVPKTFYPQSIKDRILITHEFSHCESHDLMLVLRNQFYFSAILLPLIIIVSNISIWMNISAILLSAVLSSFQFWPIVYNEIMANNHALEVINRLYGAEAMSESARYLLRVRTETLQKKVKGKNLAYITEKLQIEFLQRCVTENTLILQSSPINIWLSTIHCGLFVLAGYCFYSFIKEIEISWYMLIVATIVFILAFIFYKNNITKIWITKRIIFEKIGL